MGKSERRSFVRRNHPDVGGDVDEFRDGLKKYDVTADPAAAEPTPAVTPPAPPVTTKPPAADRLARGLGRFAATVVAKPAQARAAYREGRDTDTPL